MKFALSVLSLFVSSAVSEYVELVDIKASSSLGQKILSKARNLEEQNWNEFSSAWVADYSLKFQGCHHISQWNENANGEDDVRILTERLIRFRLCPTDTCSDQSAAGCSNGYGDYIVDMNTYLAAYFQAKQEYQQFQCEYLQQYVCYCENNGDDNYNEDMCMYDCYAAHNMEEICMDENPYDQYNNNGNNQNQQQQFNLDEYMECRQANFNNGRRLNNNNNNGNYYVGPYCASQGGAVYLGVFTDDTCTTFADENGGSSVYYQYTGNELPYSASNVVDMECFSCKEPNENNNDGNDNQDADNVAEVCETLYTYAGKCEANLPSGTTYYTNNNACNYMEGIKIFRKDGTLVALDAKANKTASVFIGVFVVAFVLLSAYVYYLKTKLDRASINLSD